MKNATVTKTEERHLRCNLTQIEIVEKAKQLAEKNRESRQLEEEKKRITSDFAAKLNGAEAEISVLSNVIQSGYEYRPVPCEITMNTPKNGKKTVVRTDSGHQIAVEDMTANEMQEEFKL